MDFFVNRSQEAFDTAATIYIEEMINQAEPLIFFSIEVNSTCCTFPDDYSYSGVTDYKTLRSDELYIIVSDNNSTVIFDQSPSNILSAQLNIGRTLFVCFLLIISTLFFSHDVETHALEPL